MGQARHPLSLLLVAGGVALALVVGLLASGCGSSGGSSSTSSTGATGGVGEARASQAPVGARVATCGSGAAGVGKMRVSGTKCGAARGVAAAWNAKPTCRAPASGSRASCSVGGYRCLGATVARGLAVTCSRPGNSISFLAKRG